MTSGCVWYCGNFCNYNRFKKIINYSFFCNQGFKIEFSVGYVQNYDVG